MEDFVDEDTGEVTSIERNEIILERETVLEQEHIDEILESKVPYILLHKESANTTDYSIIYNTLQKDPSNTEIDAVRHIYRLLRSAEPVDDASAREVINNLFFSEKRYDLGEVAATVSTRSWSSISIWRPGPHQGRYHRDHQVPHRTGQLQGHSG